MRRLYFFTSLLLAVVILYSGNGCTRTSEKVLLIFSYHTEYSWVIEETRGTEEILRDKGLQIEKFYLDTQRKTDPGWLKQVAAEAAKKIEEIRPDLVIVFDDNACDLVAKQYIGKDLRIVFCGMNGEPEEYGFPAANITGVIERLPYEQSISLLKRLAPEVKKAAILSDNSATSQKNMVEMKKSTWPIEISEFYSTNDFSSWKSKVMELRSKVDAIGILGYATIREEAQGTNLPQKDVMKWTVDNNRLPEFTFLDFAVRDGALCGVTQSGYEQGKAAAEIAVRILAGEKPGDIPIECPQNGVPMVNETRAKQLNLPIPVDVFKDVEIVR